MKTKKWNLMSAGVLAVLLALMTGCLYEALSWSPDGRYLAFASNERGVLWRWDSQSRTTEKIKLELPSGIMGSSTTMVEGKVMSCRYLPSGDKLLVLASNNNDNASLYLYDFAGKSASVLAEKTGWAFDITPDGKIYYLAEDKEKKDEGRVYAWDKGTTYEVMHDAKEVAALRLDPTGRRLAYVKENDLCALNLDDSTTKTLFSAGRGEGMKIVWPLWLDERHLMFIHLRGSNDQYGTLTALALDDKTTRTIAENVAPAYPPSFNPDRRTVAVVAQRSKTKMPGEDQVAAVELATGKLTWLTDNLIGANAPAYSPDGRTLAYLQPLYSGGKGSDNDNDRLLRLVDLKSGRDEIAWRSDEERLYANTETLERAGDGAQALAALRDLMQRYPKTSLKMVANYRMMRLCLTPALLDLDCAYALWKEFDTTEMEGGIAAMFWRAEDRVATDPPEDWITTYGTAASKKEWGANTDLTRDLRALWLRAGRERIYVRIDYGTDADLSGIALQDTLLLLREATSKDTTQTRIGAHAVWDQAATRQVLIRHWFESGENSQYDLEIKKAGGDVSHRFLVSGYAPPKDALFDRMATVPGETPGVVYAISRKVLGLEGKHAVDVQVCTFKGGVDSRQKLERPVGAGCDVADAFGAENTAARIKADEAGAGANEKEKDRLCVIKGIAGVVAVE